MTDKKSLDFDFLGDHAVDASVSVPVVAPPSDVQSEKIGFFAYFTKCYSNFNEFSAQYLIANHPRYLNTAIWVYGMGIGSAYVWDSIGNETGWSDVWTTVIAGGILTGALGWYIAGAIYHWRVKWSKGQGNINTARNIYIFSSLPIAAAWIGMLLFNQIAYGGDYITIYSSNFSTVDTIFILLILAAVIYSIYISYRVVRGVLKSEKVRAVVWFIVLPVLYYLAIIFWATTRSL